MGFFLTINVHRDFTMRISTKKKRLPYGNLLKNLLEKVPSLDEQTCSN